MAVTSLESCETTLHGSVVSVVDMPTAALGGCLQTGAELLDGTTINAIQHGDRPIAEHVNEFIDDREAKGINPTPEDERDDGG